MNQPNVNQPAFQHALYPFTGAYRNVNGHQLHLLDEGRGDTVIMLHGNGNDPRIQGESSGWVEVAATHTIMLTSIEWQGRTAQDTTFAREIRAKNFRYCQSGPRS